MMRERVNAYLEKKKGSTDCFKIIANFSYGKDGMNTSKYTNIKFFNKNKTLLKQTSPDFINTRMINTNLFLVQSYKQSYRIDIPLQCACATLDNDKYLHVNFIYNFMYKCLDMKCLHFIKSDTNSIYWAVVGDSEDGIHQGFKHVITDEEFYEENIYTWLPDLKKGYGEQKKMLGFCIENEGSEMIVLGPKCYSLRTRKRDIMKVKGFILKQNPDIFYESYRSVLKSGERIMGKIYC
jgi:hypothetical protein